MDCVYRLCLRCYPAAYRLVFANEMLDVFTQARAEAAALGKWHHFRFLVRECRGALGGACFEHSRRVLGPEITSLFPVGRLFMRSAAKFPLPALVFMVLSFFGVVYAIAKAEAVSVSVPQGNPTLELHPVHLVLPGGILLMWVVACLAGVAGWAVLFALRRSGAERLSKTETWSAAK